MMSEAFSRPEMRALFSVSRNATREDIEKSIKIIEMFKGSPADEDDIFIRLTELPDRVKAMTVVDENADYNIYINNALSPG